MKLLEHENNNPCWHSKVDIAAISQVIEFARNYQRVDANAWAVVVTEAENWIGAAHVKNLRSEMQIGEFTALWLSDGCSAQCLWRRQNGN